MDSLLLACPYCGEYMDTNAAAVKKFGQPQCCDHEMISLDPNLILTIATKGLPKLIEKFGADLVKDLAGGN